MLVAGWFGFTWFKLTETGQLELALAEDAPETRRLLPIGTC